MNVATAQRGRSGIIYRLISRDWWLALITILAAVPRLYRSGMFILWWDEVLLLRRSLRFVMLHEYSWEANQTTWSAIPIHSPITTVAYAIPYLLTHDPRAVRFFQALLAVCAVVVVYLVMRRYYGQLAATLTGLLAALSPQLIEWSRWVLNPHLAQLFIALWLLTGLVGYLEDKRWAQILHWLMLSIAAQAHLGYGYIMGPLSLVMLGMAWLRFAERRRAIVLNTAMGGVLLVLSLLPWLFGLIDAGLGTNEPGAGVENTLNWEWAKMSFSNITSSTDYWTIQRAAARADDWWPPLPITDDILRIKTWLTVIGGIGLLVLIYRRRWEAAPGVIFALLLFWPMTSFVISPVSIQPYYLMPMVFGAYAIQGIVFAQLAQVRPWARWPVLAVFAVFLVLQGWLVLGVFRWYDVGGNLERYRMSMDDMIHSLEGWRAEAAQVVVITDTKEAKFTADNQVMWWEVIGAYDGPVVVAMPQGIPIDPAGEVIAGSWAGATIPTLFGEGEPEGEIINGEPMFRKVIIPPDYHLSLDYVPENLNRYANGMLIEGLHAMADLEPGRTWRVILVWAPERAGDNTAQYQFSVRVMSGDQTYAQTDIPSLVGGLWQPGDSVINLVDLPIPADMPLDDVRIQLISYSWPDMATVSVTDDNGNPVEPWLFLRSEAE